MTLAGAAKRLRQNREGVSRDLEIIEKLQRVRSLLLDVREVLKADDDGREVFVDPTPADWDDTPVLEYGAGSDGEPAGSRLPGESSPGAETIGDRAQSVTDTAFRHEADNSKPDSGEGQGAAPVCEPRCAEMPEGLAEPGRRGDRQRMRSRAGSAVFYPARDSRTASAFPGAALAYGRTRGGCRRAEAGTAQGGCVLGRRADVVLAVRSVPPDSAARQAHGIIILLIRKMKVREVAGAIEEFAPLGLQESYDNSGLNVGSPDAEVSGVLICVDVTDEVVDEALAVGANLIVSHHPLLFHPLRRLVGGDPAQRIAARCVIAGISLYAAHTNLDSADGGMSHALGRRLGLRDMRLLCPHAPGGHTGYGVVGELAEAVPILRFLSEVKRSLRCGAIRYSPLCRNTVSRVALSTGAGASLIEAAAGAKADVYLSADFKYNDFFGPDGRLVVADVGHFESEYCAIDLLYDIITKKIANFAVRKSERSVNPINYLV